LPRLVPASTPGERRRLPTLVRAAAGTVGRRTYAPQPRRFTGRATALFAVFVALALAYTYPVRVFLGQQADIARMEAEQQAQREHIGELSEEAKLWKDPAFITTKAKERFYMVRPGEQLLVILTDPEGAARDAGTTAEPAPKPAEPWYDMLWSSVQAANEEGPAR
ncbi:septum formation initiator family protein, partial [Micromonospora sp. NPDC049523]|uniref:FtsB family cell division protein n=1 Tax=Micromonospora sp. NPDC049523 TaxID=3155921 RepID=UPI00341341A0